MTAYLVRHGTAGSREEWHQPDDLRPLDDEGRRQAEGLADQLAGCPVDRILSSSALRCRETVEPLAARRGLAVELADELVDTAGVDEALALLERHAGEHVVLSTHGELVPDVIRRLADGGMVVEGDGGWDKGSTWVLEREGDRWARARWLAPPT